MRALWLLVPLSALSCEGCRWFTDPPTSGIGWYVEQPGYAAAQPGLAGDTVFVASGDGHLFARDANTGAERWKQRIASRAIEGGNIVAAGGVVVVPILFETKALDAATGALLWTYSAPADTVGGTTAPGQVKRVRIASLGSTVFVPAWGGTIAALDLRTGAEQWRWDPPALPFRFGAQGVAAADGMVVALVWHFLNATGTASEARVVALDALTGAERWHTVLPNQESVVCVSGAPAITPSAVVVTTISGRTYGLDRATGTVLWQLGQDVATTEFPFYSVITGAVASRDTVFADAGTGNLRAIDAATGRVLWRTRFGVGSIGDEITLSPTRLYAPNGGYLYVFDRATGAHLRTVTQPGGESNSLFSASLAADARRVYAPVKGAVWSFPH